LEGALLQPKHVNELCSQFPSQVHACFLGYAKAEIREKFKQIRRYGGGPEDWMMRFDDTTVRNELERLKKVSEFLQEECRKYQLLYFETSIEFDKSIEKAMEYLTGGQ
jgi:hypothetical protein